MKMKGFTLVELLAVIVILAIIALIATPMILGVIEDARKGSAKSSALGYAEAVEKSSLIYAVNNGSQFKDGIYKTEDGKTITKEDDNTVSYTIDYKGDVAEGTLTISNGEVIEAKLTFKSIIDKKVKISDNKATLVNYGVTKELPKNDETYKAIVYLDPTDLTKECNSENVVSTTGTKEGCMKFYAFAETDTTYELILDHNTTPVVAWVNDEDYAEANSDKTECPYKACTDEGPVTAMKKLKEDTKNWKQTARLITADEIAILTGADKALSWTSDKKHAYTPEIGTSISYFYLDGASGTDKNWQKFIAKTPGSSKYNWLFDGTNGCANYGCTVEDNNGYKYGSYTYIVKGYWTSTPVIGQNDLAWFIINSGMLSYYSHNNNVYYESPLGVRPVITISKSIIS